MLSWVPDFDGFLFLSIHEIKSWTLVNHISPIDYVGINHQIYKGIKPRGFFNHVKITGSQLALSAEVAVAY